MKLLGTDIIEIDPDFISKYGIEMTSIGRPARSV